MKRSSDRMRALLITAFAAAGLAGAGPASANDTTADLKTGGLIFVRNDVIAMQREDLYISPDAVRVDYVFRNTSDADVDTVVAFPMPDITAQQDYDVAVPERDSDNFLGFEVEADGQTLEPTLEQKAFAAELDVTELLADAGVPLNPYAEATQTALDGLPLETRRDWTARGLLYLDRYDAGQGWQESHRPTWRLKSTYWWRMRFPANKPVAVKHRYQPSVGGTVAVTFLEDGKPTPERHDDYVRKYCIDRSFEQAVLKAAKRSDGYPPFFENWISYVLTTGANWATTIETFHLTIDKGDTKNLVSFCGEGVKKTGPTTFEMTKTDFYPTRDLDILILRPTDTRQ